MRKPSKRSLAAVLAVLVVVSTAAPVLAAFLDTAPTVNNGPRVGAENGPVFGIQEATQQEFTGQATDPNTFEVRTDAGNATLSSPGRTSGDIDKLTGEWTNTSDLDVTGAELTIDPEDKRAISVSGDTDSLDFRDAKADDGKADFVYAGTSGTTTVTVRGLDPDTDYLAVGSGALLTSATSDSNGVVTFSGMTNSEHTVSIKESDGGPGLSNPSPEGPQSDFPTELAVNVSDPDFGDGEEVDVEFYLDGTSEGTVTTTSAGKVMQTIATPSRGSHDVRAVATDSQGNVKELTWQFSVPNELTVKRATPDHEVINDRQVNFTFYESDGRIEKRSTTTGTLDLEGLDIEGDIVAEIDAEATSGVGVKDRAYYDSSVIIEDITKQQTVYLLDTNVTTKEVRFTLRDRTGKFKGNNATLFIQKPINDTGTLKYQTIHADEFGAAGGVTADLEDGQRYRLVVKNADNDTRVLGSYTVDVSETVELTVGAVREVPDGTGLDYSHNATYINSSASTTNYVKFAYNDSADLTNDLTLEVHERGNRSNKLVDNRTFSGPLGTFSTTEPVPDGQEDATWVVLATIDRDGETRQLKTTVGPRRPLLESLSGWVKAVISVGTIFVVAGLFSQLNGDVGALVVAGLGGIFWYIDFMPQETGAGVVALAMMVAGIVFVNERRGSTI